MAKLTNRAQAYTKAQLMAERYFRMYDKFIYPADVYTKLLEKYNLY